MQKTTTKGKRNKAYAMNPEEAHSQNQACVQTASKQGKNKGTGKTSGPVGRSPAAQKAKKAPRG